MSDNVKASPALPSSPKRRRWGAQQALFDDKEATQRLLDAAAKCIVERGTARVSMADVAEMASVTRSTLYRYFPSRTELITALLLTRSEARMAAAVATLPDPNDAATSLPLLLLAPLMDNSLARALFSPDSESFVAMLELESGALVEATYRPIGFLLERWQAEGQIYPDLNLKTTVRWLIAQSVLLMSSQWQAPPESERRSFVEQYILRAILTPQ